MNPPVTLTAEETDRLLAYLAEVPARLSFDAISLLLRKRAEAAEPQIPLPQVPPGPAQPAQE